MSNKLLSVFTLFLFVIIVLIYRQNQNLSGMIVYEKGLLIGDEAYLFNAITMNGNSVSIDSKISLLIFFNATCEACQITVSQWQELYDRYQSETVSIIAISKEAGETTEGFVLQYNLSLPIILDTDGALQRHYSIRFSPQLVIVNANGRIAYYQQYDIGARRAFIEAEAILRDLQQKTKQN